MSTAKRLTRDLNGTWNEASGVGHIDPEGRRGHPPSATVRDSYKRPGDVFLWSFGKRSAIEIRNDLESRGILKPWGPGR